MSDIDTNTVPAAEPTVVEPIVEAEAEGSLQEQLKAHLEAPMASQPDHPQVRFRGQIKAVSDVEVYQNVGGSLWRGLWIMGRFGEGIEE